MISKNALLTLLLLLPTASSQAFCASCNITLQQPWNDNAFHPIISVSLLQFTDRTPYVYYEYGITALPRFGAAISTRDTSVSSVQRLFSLYGLFGGTYINIFPIFRPGIIIGSVLRQNASFSGSDTPYELKAFQIDYYAGFSLHIGILSLLVTNYGFGAGLNWVFSR